MTHPIQETVLAHLKSAAAFDDEGRRMITAAYVATFAQPGFIDATRALIEVSAALRRAGKNAAALTLAVLALSGGSMLRRRAAVVATDRTTSAADSARKLTGHGDADVPRATTTAPPPGAMKASVARFPSSTPKKG